MAEKFLGTRVAFLRMFSGAVAVQAMLSASSFIVGLLLVRRTSDEQYGYYVLITTAILLMTTLQSTFIQPPMVIRLTRSNLQERSDLIGGLYRDQRRLLPFLIIGTLVVAVVLAFKGRLDLQVLAVLAAGSAAAIATLHREFMRMVLFAYRRPHDVLNSDSIYCVLLILGAYVATLSALPAATAALTMTLACFAGASLSSKALWRHEPWNPKAPIGMLREIAPLGAWSAFGGVTHWVFSQGYNYVVAGTLDVTAVAALAATRLLVMPVNLLSTGIGTLMLPTVSRWMHDKTAATVLRRLMVFSLGLAVTACCYLLVMWLMRGWIFAHLLKKNFTNRDTLLALWSLIAIIMVFRDQLLYFLVARARFRHTSTLTLISAVLAITSSLIAMHKLGVAGALLGLAAGELFNVLGIVVLSIREARLRPAAGTVATVS